MKPVVGLTGKLKYLKLKAAYHNLYSSLHRQTDAKGGFLDSSFNTTTSTVSTTKNNLLVNMPEKSDPHKASIAITKNSMLNKCKRIYL